MLSSIICGGDTGTPVEWNLICGYPVCDEPAVVDSVAATPVCEAFPSAETFATADASSGAAASDLTENKQTDALKELSSLA